ncbi:transposase [Methanosarcina thermophila]|uniref:Transposase n=1 Tax=Methanosarcina thermophila TaxID=2210 RepID=A0A3G9D021_METTE|nr:transposase [Methanosarcina thermophila]BAW30700.1 transposase [Methanosarcina thermophila]
MIKKSNRSRKSQCYVMDNGYDSEEIHTLIRNEIKADSIVPLRERKRMRINGKYRKQ